VKNEAYADDLNPSIEYSETVNDIQVIIPEGYNRKSVCDKLGKSSTDIITTSDLENLTTLYVSTDDDVSFLKYCTNLEYLSLKCNTYEGIENLANIPSFDKLKSVSFSCSGGPISKEQVSFLINSPNISYICLNNSTNFKDGVLSSIKGLDTIELTAGLDNSYNTNLDDLVNIKSLKNLIINSYLVMPLNLAISLDTNTYNTLKNNGVNIDFGDNKYFSIVYEKTFEQLFLEINTELDNIIKSLDIDENSSDIEKYNKVLLYVIENLSYDPNISQKIKDGENFTHEDHLEFYDIGALQGALMNDTAICGNYTALLSALCKRVGLESYYVSGHLPGSSYGHAWNLIKIGDEYYYADSTAFDSEGIIETIVVDEDGNILDETDEAYSYSDCIITTVGRDVESKKKAMEDGTISKYSQYLIDLETEDRVEESIPIDFENGKPKYLQGDTSSNISEDTEETGLFIDNLNIETSSNIDNISTSDETAIDITDKKFKINLAGKVVMISAPILIGALSVLGLAHKKKKNMIRTQQNIDSFYEDSYNAYDNYDRYNTYDSYDDYDTYGNYRSR
ncbi:MAG: transglutaminase-like domain-containing protein, partial [Bacilli bacterium]